jgi:hypothetical protein
MEAVVVRKDSLAQTQSSEIVAPSMVIGKS